MSCSILSKSPQPQASLAESQESSRASSRDLFEGSAQEAGLDRHDSAFRREGLRQEAEDALTSLPCCEDLPDGAAAKSPFSSWDLEEEPLEVSARTASKSAARGQSGPRSMRTADSVPQGPGAPPRRHCQRRPRRSGAAPHPQVPVRRHRCAAGAGADPARAPARRAGAPLGHSYPGTGIWLWPKQKRQTGGASIPAAGILSWIDQVLVCPAVWHPPLLCMAAKVLIGISLRDTWWLHAGAQHCCRSPQCGAQQHQYA